MRTLIAAVLVLAACTPVASARTWTDSTGKHTVEAEFVDLKDGKVRLKKDDGKTITIPIEKLSEADQEYARKQKPATERGDENRSAKEAFIAAFKGAHSRKDSERLSKLIFKVEKYPPFVITLWASEMTNHFGQEIKTVSVVADANAATGIEFPLPTVGRLEVVFQVDSKVAGRGHATGTQTWSVPLCFTDGSYYFMLPKSMMQAADGANGQAKPEGISDKSSERESRNESVASIKVVKSRVDPHEVSVTLEIAWEENAPRIKADEITMVCLFQSQAAPMLKLESDLLKKLGGESVMNILKSGCMKVAKPLAAEKGGWVHLVISDKEDSKMYLGKSGNYVLEFDPQVGEGLSLGTVLIDKISVALFQETDPSKWQQTSTTYRLLSNVVEVPAK